jgi:hypothetical protein
MSLDDKRKAYKAFFAESPAGQSFMEELDRLIDDAHRKAEDTPELSRDHMQRAKGLRAVKDHIASVGMESKKVRP